MSPVLARLARTLPLTILATALLLVLKLADLGQTVAQLRSGGAVVTCSVENGSLLIASNGPESPPTAPGGVCRRRSGWWASIGGAT